MSRRTDQAHSRLSPTPTDMQDEEDDVIAPPAPRPEEVEAGRAIVDQTSAGIALDDYISQYSTRNAARTNSPTRTHGNQTDEAELRRQHLLSVLQRASEIAEEEESILLPRSQRLRIRHGLHIHRTHSSRRNLMNGISRSLAHGSTRSAMAARMQSAAIGHGAGPPK